MASTEEPARLQVSGEDTLNVAKKIQALQGTLAPGEQLALSKMLDLHSSRHEVGRRT